MAKGLKNCDKNYRNSPYSVKISKNLIRNVAYHKFFIRMEVPSGRSVQQHLGRMQCLTASVGRNPKPIQLRSDQQNLEKTVPAFFEGGGKRSDARFF
jgi:hypothetical protein